MISHMFDLLNPGSIWLWKERMLQIDLWHNITDSKDSENFLHTSVAANHESQFGCHFGIEVGATVWPLSTMWPLDLVHHRLEQCIHHSPSPCTKAPCCHHAGKPQVLFQALSFIQRTLELVDKCGKDVLLNVPQ